MFLMFQYVKYDSQPALWGMHLTPLCPVGKELLLTNIQNITVKALDLNIQLK